MNNDYFNIDREMFTSPSTSALNQNIHQAPNYHQFNRSVSIFPSYTTSTVTSNHSRMSNFSLPSSWPFEQDDGVDIHGALSSFSSAFISSSSNVEFEEPSRPKLEIIVQPPPFFTFRYISEMRISHGQIRSCHGSLHRDVHDKKKISPTVHLLNFKGTARIRCFLYQLVKNGERPKLHPNYLWRKTESETIETDPIYIDVNETNNWTATFPGLAIIYSKKKDTKKCLINKSIEQMKLDRGYNDFNQLQKAATELVEKDGIEIEFDRVMLGFDAFELKNDQTWAKIAGPEFSTPIGNSKSAKIGLLKIYDISSDSGNVLGHEKMLIFCSKVNGDDIKVIFTESDGSWKDDRILSPEAVHHQYGIALRTPPYRYDFIDQDVTVQIMLYRPSDKATSAPWNFTYCSIASLLKDCDAFTSKVEHLAHSAIHGDNLTTDAASVRSTRTKKGQMFIDLNRERMFLELCTGLSVSKLSGLPRNSQHPSNWPCDIESSGEDSEDVDDSGSEYCYETVDGLSTPTEANESKSEKTNADESNRTTLTKEEHAELTDLLNKLNVKSK